MSEKYVYFFLSFQAEGQANLKNLLGGKGANLAEMNRLGLPVPPGFTVTTEVCTHYYQNQQRFPTSLVTQVEENLKKEQLRLRQIIEEVKHQTLYIPEKWRTQVQNINTPEEYQKIQL